MENQYKEIVIKIQTMENTFVAFFQGTNQPFVTCDKETFNDQIWVFTSEEQAKAFGEKYLQEKIPLIIVRMENKQLLGFYSSLYALGINEIVLVDGDTQTKLPLEKLVRKPDYSKLPKEKHPLTNPQLQLTGIYFMQELRRQIPMEEKKNLKELEEEMVVNLVRSNFLVALEIGGDKAAKDGSNVKIPCVKSKDGKMYQPLFTDMGEFNKFNGAQKFRASMVPFAQVSKIMGSNVEGLVVNPQGVNIVILRERLNLIQNRFSGE